MESKQRLPDLRVPQSGFIQEWLFKVGKIIFLQIYDLTSPPSRTHIIYLQASSNHCIARHARRSILILSKQNKQLYIFMSLIVYLFVCLFIFNSVPEIIQRNSLITEIVKSKPAIFQWPSSSLAQSFWTQCNSVIILVSWTKVCISIQLKYIYSTYIPILF